MKPIRRILFAVRDPAARRQPGLAKALGLASALDASVELFHALATPVLGTVQALMGDSLEKLQREARRRARRRLEGIAVGAAAHGVPVSCVTRWDYPPHEAILRQATKAGADLIIVEAHRGGHRHPWLMQLTDWELLRLSRIPILVIRDLTPYERPVVLAAVDPSHAHAKPLDLDAVVLDAAQQARSALGGSLHAIHACHVTNSPTAVFDPMLNPYSLSGNVEGLRRFGRDLFLEQMKSAGIPTTHRHLVYGEPAKLIPRIARKLKADIVVMGAVSRSGLKRLFIGNTAEQVIDELPCDVLVVKSRSFEKRVRHRTRGVRVISPMPFAPTAF
jgi:universal stress protein E